MFGNKKDEEKNNNKKSGIMPTSPNAINSLVKGTKIEGTISSDSDFRVDGQIKGTLNCKAKVIIGPTGFINGEIRCNNAVIEGRFEGTLKVKELLNVRETAQVSGDIDTNKLIVQSGAVFNVSCQMGENKSTGNGMSHKPSSGQAADKKEQAKATS